MTHHPHVHMIVPGGGLSDDGERWVPCRKGFFLPVRVLSKLFRRLMLEKLVAAHVAGKLNFFGVNDHLGHARAFKTFLRPARRSKWFVYAKRPFAGPKAVLAYLSRYTHRVAISNQRLIKADNLVRMRELLDAVAPEVGAVEDGGDESPPDADAQPCPSCGGTMRIIEVFEAGCTPRLVATPEGIDSS